MSENGRYWSVPRMWEDETVFIIGGGPSLVGADYSPIHHRAVIGTNSAYKLGQWVDIVYFGDYRWWAWNKQDPDLLAYGGLFATNCQDNRLFGIDRLKVLKRNNRLGIWTRSVDTACWNLNTGCSAINLAVHLGAKKIVLLGFDMKVDHDKGFNKGHNWHPEHQAHHTPNDDIYTSRFLKAFGPIARDLNELKVGIYNANEDSTIPEEQIQKMTFAEGMTL